MYITPTRDAINLMNAFVRNRSSRNRYVKKISQCLSRGTQRWKELNWNFQLISQPGQIIAQVIAVHLFLAPTSQFGNDSARLWGG